jgi:hypothetical protein
MTKVQKRLVASAAAIALIAGLFVGIQPIGGRAAVGGMNINAEDAEKAAILDTINGATVTFGDQGAPSIVFSGTGADQVSFTLEMGGDAVPDNVSYQDDGTGKLSGSVGVTVGGTTETLTFTDLTGSESVGSSGWGYTGTAYYGAYDYNLTVAFNGTGYDVTIAPGTRAQPDPVVPADPVEETPAPAPAPDPLANYVPGPGGATPSATTETPAAETVETPAAPVADVAATADGDVDTAAAATFLTEAAAEAVSSGETEVVAEIASDVTVISETAIAELIASVPEDIEVKLESKVETADGKDAGAILIPLTAEMTDVKTGIKAASETAIEKTAATLDAEFVGGFTTEQRGTFGTAVTFSLKASAFGIDVETDLADCEISSTSGLKVVYIVVVVDGKATQIKGLIRNGKIIFKTDLAGTYYVSAKPVL